MPPDDGRGMIAKVKPDSIAIYAKIEAEPGTDDMRSLVTILNMAMATLKRG